MRKSKLTREEVQEAELAEFDRRQGRNTGFAKMHERDKGWARLENGVVIEWPVDPEMREEWVPYQNVPEGHFVLHINGKKILFEADDFLKYLRWV